MVKGSRASKKSTTAALKIIFKMMQYPLANTLVVRKTAASLKDSCWTQLRWAIERLGVSQYWRVKVSPLEIEYIPTGQKILFRGLDDPLKTTSITVKTGVLCWGWLEEAYEVDEDSFNRIDESLRGQLPEGYYIQWIISFNPWDAGCWIKSRFFDQQNDNVLAMTTTYKCNEWLSEQDKAMFDEMALIDPERYKVAGLGEWGIAEGQYFKQWSEAKHVVEPFEIPKNWLRYRSMDWGSARPYACHWWAVDYDGNIWCYRELYGWGGKPNVGTGETAKQVGEKIAEIESKAENVSYGVLDNACWANVGVSGPSIAEELNDELNKHGLVTFGKCSKGRVEGANALKERLIGNRQTDGTYKPALYVFKNCIHAIRTIPMLSHDKAKPETYDTKGEDHCFIAGTMIATRRGNVPIEDIKLDDYVLTRKGYRRVLASGKTKENAEVMTAYFSDGSTLTATKNHPVFFKEIGFVPFDTMPYGGIIYSIKEVCKSCQENRPKQQIVSCSMESLSDVIRSQKENRIEGITEQMEDFGNKVLATCTMKYGKPITARFQKVSTFITKMGIRSITIYRISNYYQEASICRNTQQSDGKTPQSTNLKCGKKFKARQRNGTSQKLAGNGISNTLKKLLNMRKRNPRLNLCVQSVEKNTLSQVCEGICQDSALKLVTQNTDVTVGLTTRTEPALFVEKRSMSTASANRKRVAVRNVTQRQHLPVVLLRTQNEKKKHDVYNLTVDEVHEYFANGILVHNCADSFCYSVMSRPWAPTKAKTSSSRVDGWVEKKPRSAWTY